MGFAGYNLDIIPWIGRSPALAGLVAGLACACASLLAPALAAARADDGAATRAYLRASEAYERGASANVEKSVAAIAARASEIARECPGALTYAPRDAAFQELGEETATLLFYAGSAATSATRLGFARSIRGLSWSDRRLTRLVRAQAATEATALALALPNVCADIEAWKASAYAVLPQSATAFLAQTDAIESEEFVGSSEELREAAINRLLKRYETPNEKLTAKRLEQREQRTDRQLGASEEAAHAMLVAALGVSTL